MKKRDLLLIACLLILACVLLGVGLAQRGRIALPAAEPGEGSGAELPEAVAAFFDEYPAESYMIVTTAKGLHAPVPLNGENELRLTQEDGSENVIHIGKNAFYMASSNCENQNCVQQGEVTLENRDSRLLFDMVICLPHNLSLQLLSREETEALLTELYTQAEAPSGANGDAD